MGKGAESSGEKSCEFEGKIRIAQKNLDVDEILKLTDGADLSVREKALKGVCPAVVLDRLSDFQEKVRKMVDHEDQNVRENALRMLSSLSYDDLKSQIDEAKLWFNKDVLGTYYKTGKWIA